MNPTFSRYSIFVHHDASYPPTPWCAQVIERENNRLRLSYRGDCVTSAIAGACALGIRQLSLSYAEAMVLADQATIDRRGSYTCPMEPEHKEAAEAVQSVKRIDWRLISSADETRLIGLGVLWNGPAREHVFMTAEVREAHAVK